MCIRDRVRTLYQCFEANVKASDSSVFDHEMPGGQYTNLMFQSQQLGLGAQWNEIKNAYMEANMLCGDIVKVTPSSKVVGDLAQFMVANKLNGKEVEERASSLDFPVSVIEYFQGFLGTPPGGFPEPLRTNIIRNKERVDGRRGAQLEPLDFGKIRADLEKQFKRPMSESDAVSWAMYPKVFEEFQNFVSEHGDLSRMATRDFLGKPEVGKEIQVTVEDGKVLIIKLLSMSPLDEETGTREVFFELNAEPRAITVQDRSANVQTVQHEKATSEPGSVGSPLAGVVVEIRAKEGEAVKAGDALFVMSAMKMETVVSAPVDGKIKRVAVAANDSLSQGDLMCEIAE